MFYGMMCLNRSPNPRRLSLLRDVEPPVSYGRCILRPDSGEDNNALRNDFGNYSLWSDLDGVETVYVPTRNEKVSVMLSGTTSLENGQAYSHTDTRRKATRLFLSMNEESNDMRMKDVVWARIYQQLTGAFSLSIIASSLNHSELILMSQAQPMWLLGAQMDDQLFLIWTTESNIETRLREEYPFQILFYRLPHLFNGCSVIHPIHMCGRVKRWLENGMDKLKLFSALEDFIMKTTQTLPFGQFSKL